MPSEPIEGPDPEQYFLEWQVSFRNSYGHQMTGVGRTSQDAYSDLRKNLVKQLVSSQEYSRAIAERLGTLDATA